MALAVMGPVAQRCLRKLKSYASVSGKRRGGERETAARIEASDLGARGAGGPLIESGPVREPRLQEE